MYFSEKMNYAIGPVGPRFSPAESKELKPVFNTHDLIFEVVCVFQKLMRKQTLTHKTGSYVTRNVA